jgi:TonB family protein
LYDDIDLIVADEKRKAGGITVAVVVSLVLHSLLLVLFIRSYRAAPDARDIPIARYVELIKQNPQDFVEAPGPAVDRARLNAPLSDANRRASMPEPTGLQPTNRPGQGGGIYTPPPSRRGPQVASPQQREVAPQRAQPAAQEVAPDTPSDAFVYRETQPRAAAANAAVDWRSAIREVGKVASLGGGEGVDLGQVPGGEEGSAETGPLSFETQWYDWGPYAQSMVSKIRVNWYAGMPQLIRSGIKGVVTIRFTIQRSGQITDLAILKTSGIPPYDFAAKKAIELSSPLNPLPKDFPNPTERVTCMFYYNMEVPTR